MDQESLVEYRYRAVCEVLGGSPIGEVALRHGTTRNAHARDHEGTGCTAISFDAGPFAECRCSGHRAACAEADLFASDLPT